ncbi:glycosyltransferase [Cupriavidus basilensis]|uniref:glycosyltransferase n=1 Tax=Cupriavidus basilensis TaxID=68895 RepID=UPI0009E3FCF4|nr:glycosyltransferase [Cupriavidus basilensis]
MKIPKISIIIPTYNMARFLPDCLGTLRRQNYQNLELIIVDGLSTDNISEIVEANRDIVDIFISEPDQGQGDAVTKGLRIATGDICHWHAADDIFMPNALDHVAEAFNRNPQIDLLISDGWAFDTHHIVRTGKCRWISYERSLFFKGRFQSDCAYWRREITHNALPLDIEKPLTVDEDFFLRLWNGRPHLWLSEPLGAFRMHGEQVSQTVDRSVVWMDRHQTRKRIFEEKSITDTDAAVARKRLFSEYILYDLILPRVTDMGDKFMRMVHRDLNRRRFHKWLMNEWIGGARNV